MSTSITVATATDSITFSGTDIESGWTYDNACLDSWYSVAKPVGTFTKRGSAHGSFDPGQLFTGDSTPAVTGRYWGKGIADAHAAKVRLAGLFSDGYPVTVTVTDELGATTRTCYVMDVDIDWSPYREFEFSLAFEAPDPRRYGNLITFPSTGLPTPPSGLVWPLGTSAKGLYFDWGTAGNPGSITITNDGNATAYPSILVGGGGAFQAGFRMTETDTARELDYPVALAATDVLTLDNRTRRARLNGTGDVTEALTSRGWFSIPAHSSRTYLLTSLGGVTGSPVFSATLKPANL